MKALTLLSIISLIFGAATLQAAAPAKNSPKKPAKPEHVDPKKLLDKYDEDKDGKLDKKELALALKSLKENSVTTKNDSWKRFDKDGDGKINLAELTDLLKENK